MYHQVQQWRGNNLQPTEWGWKLSEKNLLPIPMLKSPALDSLIHLVCCNCEVAVVVRANAEKGFAVFGNVRIL